MVSQEVTGRIVKLDELHFDLADGANNRHRFFVAMDAVLDAGELPQLQRDGTRVVVVYDDDTPGGPVAHRVFRARSEGPVDTDPPPAPSQGRDFRSRGSS